jgi:hypothetical protein
LTIVRSITVMKYATANSANARQRPVFRDGGGIGPPVIDLELTGASREPGCPVDLAPISLRVDS